MHASWCRSIVASGRACSFEIDSQPFLKLNTWLLYDALPLWSSLGFDHSTGRFQERLSWLRRPVPGVPRRLLSQARQVFVLASVGKEEGTAKVIEAALLGFRSMERDFFRRDGGHGWVFAIDGEGEVLDARRDFYGHAFVLLAAAAIYDLTKDPSIIELVRATLKFLDDYLRVDTTSGYWESWPKRAEFRRQNPHMHLLEAMLALWECTGDAEYLDRAKELYLLFSRKFFHPTSGMIIEMFEEDLSPASGSGGGVAEPGHMYEWIWLLRRLEYATGRSLAKDIDRIYQAATSRGHCADGLVRGAVLLDGTSHPAPIRVWQTCEAMRATLIEGMLGRIGAEVLASKLAGLLFARFLKPAPQGGWFDRVDREGKPLDDYMPASALYHLAGCIMDSKQLLKESGYLNA